MQRDDRRHPPDNPRYPAATPEETVRRVLEPAERILWTGRPDLEALIAEARRRSGMAGVLKGVLRALAVVVVVAGGWAYLNDWDLLALLAFLEITAATQTLEIVAAPLVFLGFIGLIHGLHVASARKFIERAKRLTYAITDRRLLVMVGSDVEHDFGPDEVREIHLRERTRGFRDVILARRPRRGSGRGESLLAREKRYVGFKALPDAERIEELVERWREAHLASAERSLADFLEEEGVAPSRKAATDPAPIGEGPREGDEDAFGGGARTLRHGRYGLSVEFPEEWEVQVRHRRKPYGTFFLDNLEWQSPDETADWNVVNVEGPFETRVEIHVDAVTEPVTTFEKATESTLGRWITGEVVESEPELRRGRFRGWSVTRRREGVATADIALGRPAFFRLTQLYDGAVQIALVSHWPGGSRTLAEAVDRVEGSVSVDAVELATTSGPATAAGSRESVTKPGSRYSTALGCAGGLVSAARVGLGVLIIGIGVWAGYDQATRVEAYNDALDRLAAAAEEGLPRLSADGVVGTYDGQLAFLQGDLRSPSVTDPLTGLTVESWRLRRIVETVDPDASSPLADTSIVTESLELGAWRLSAYAYGSGEEVAVPDDMLARAALEEPWMARSGFVVSDAHPDVRLTYRYHVVSPGPRTVIGIPEDGLLDLDDDLAQAPLMVDGSVAPEAMVAVAADTSRTVQSAWMLWAWVGLMLSLRPLARPFTLLQSYTEAPFLRRQLLGAGISAAVVLVLALILS